MFKKINSFLNLKYAPLLLSISLVLLPLIQGTNRTIIDLVELDKNFPQCLVLFAFELISFFYLTTLSDKKNFFTSGKETPQKKLSGLKYFYFLVILEFLASSTNLLLQNDNELTKISLTLKVVIFFIAAAMIEEFVFRGIFFSHMLRTKSIFFASFLHAIFNLSTITSIIFNGSNEITFEYINDDNKYISYVYLIVILLELPLFFIAKKTIKQCTKNNETQQNKLLESDNGHHSSNGV